MQMITQHVIRHNTN